MESFCGICKKEVCNKYFLKSHLLNKHGIQLEDYIAANFNSVKQKISASISSSASTSSSSSSSSTKSTPPAVFEEYFDNNILDQQKYLSNQSKLNKNMSSSQFSSCQPNNQEQFLFENSPLVLNKLLNSHIMNADQTNKSFGGNDFVSDESIDKMNINHSSDRLNVSESSKTFQQNENHKLARSHNHNQLIKIYQKQLEQHHRNKNESFDQYHHNLLKDEEAEDQYNRSRYQHLINEDEDGTDNERSDSFSTSAETNNTLFNHYLNLAIKQQTGKNNESIESIGEMFPNLNGGYGNEQTFWIQNSTSSTNGPTTQDFCDLCQKQFCNKYYLKKHKQDVHGLHGNETITNNNFPRSSFINSSPSTISNKPLKIPLMTSLKLTPISSIKKISDNSYGHSLTLNNHSIPMTTSPSSHSVSSSSSYSTLTSAKSFNKTSLLTTKTLCKDKIKEESNIVENDQNFEVAEDDITKNDANFNKNTKLMDANDNEDQSFTINNQVKCELCTKIFYNNEFLALHKLNKHKLNILSYDPSNLSKINKENPANAQSNKLNNLKQSPINTNIQSSQNNNINNQQDPPNILYNESFCEYCNKSFCNKYFLRTHMQKAHGKTLIIENNSNNSIINNLIQFNSSNNSSDIEQSNELINEIGDEINLNLNETFFASKIVDRVVCDICNKHVCNKYFLRTHKQKVHGINDPILVTSSISPSSQHPPSISASVLAAVIAAASANKTANINELIDSELVDSNDLSKYGNFNQEYNNEEIEEGEKMCKKQLSFHPSDHYENDEKELGELPNTITGNDNCNITKKRRNSCSSINSNLSMQTIDSSKSQSLQNTQIIHHQEFSKNFIDTQSLKQSNTIFYNKNSYCTLCKRQFYSKCFLKNHLSKIHGINTSNFNEEKINEKNSNRLNLNKLLKKRQLENQLCMLEYNKNLKDTKAKKNYHLNMTNGNSIKVCCKICQKELCNKYFLRQHVFNSHKLTLNEYLLKYNNIEESFSFNNNNQLLEETLNIKKIPLVASNNISKFRKYLLKKNKLLMKALHEKKRMTTTRKVNDDSSIIKHSGNSCEANMFKKRPAFSGSSENDKNDDKTKTSIIKINNENESSLYKSKYKKDFDKNNFTNKIISSNENKLFKNKYQPFFIESNNDHDQDDEFKNYFTPCIIYLPCKTTLNKSLSLKIKLKPVNSKYEDEITEKDYINLREEFENTNSSSNDDYGALVNQTDKLK